MTTSSGYRRDPFARGEYARFTVVTHGRLGNCAWCGNTPRLLYRYVWVSDDRPSRDWWGAHLFCNLGCHDSYQGA